MGRVVLTARSSDSLDLPAKSVSHFLLSGISGHRYFDQPYIIWMAEIRYCVGSNRLW